MYRVIQDRRPRDEIDRIGKEIIDSCALVAGYIPPTVGLLNLDALTYEQADGFEFKIMLDRNLASRMAQVAAGQPTNMNDPNKRLAVNMMAFAQANDIILDPSISFHELASIQGNDKAHEEIRWFRASDEGGNAQQWIDLALGKIDCLHLSTPPPTSGENLAFPLAGGTETTLRC